MSTFAELKFNVSKELGLDTTASGNDDTLLGRRLNEAVRRSLVATQCYVISDTITLAANDNEYELNAALSLDPLAIDDIVNSDGYPLESKSVREILELRRGAPTSTGSSVSKYAVNGANLLMVYPTPSAAGTLTVYYVPTPTVMSADAHDPATTTYGNIPTEYHELIEFWACFRMASMRDDASSAMGQAYKTLFDDEVARVRKAIRRRGGRKLGPVRRGGRTSAPSDPSRT